MANFNQTSATIAKPKKHILKLNQTAFLVVLIYILISCEQSIEGNWVFDSAEHTYFIDTSQTVGIDRPDLKTFLELPKNDTLYCSRDGQLTTSKESFKGKWYFDKESMLWFDVDWGPKFNDLYMGAGRIIAFTILENDNDNLKLLFETEIGNSEITFLKQK